MEVLKYVVLRFNSARLFRKDGESGPETFKEPITKFQVANMLNALTNQKLVPTRRETLFSHTLMDWAEECYIAIDEQPTIEYPMKSGVFRVPMTFMQTNKSKTNSNHKSSRLEWYDMVEELNKVSPDEFYVFMDMLKTKWDVDVNMPFNDAIIKIYTSPNWIEFENYLTDKIVHFKGWLAAISGIVNEHFDEFLVKEGEMYLGHMVNYRRAKGNSASEIKRARNLYTSHIIHKGIDQYERYDGKILVPIRALDDEDLEETEDYKLLVNGPGVATILDDGSVCIESVERPRNIDFVGFNKVNGISLETVTYKEFK